MALRGSTMTQSARDGVSPDEDGDASPLAGVDRGALRMCRIWEAALGDGPVRPDVDYWFIRK
jgi:hypothetical protein